MKNMLKGALGVMIAAVVVALAFGYAQSAPPSPGQALLWGADVGAPMKMTISQQCRGQYLIAVSMTAVEYTTRSWHYSEKTLIESLSPATVQAVCKKSGTFPSDHRKAKLYYQYIDAERRFEISVVGADVAETAIISETCVALTFPTVASSVWSGLENTDPANSKETFSGKYYPMLSISIPSTDVPTFGSYMTLTGIAEEKLNLTALNKKGAQTLTDMITWNSSGFSYSVDYGTDPADCTTSSYESSCVWSTCTGTIHANGKIGTK
jgi:hypothetical protein